AGRYCFVEIQLAIVIGVCLVAGEIYNETACRLKRHAMCLGKKRLIDQFIGFTCLSFKNHLLYLRKSTCRLFIIIPIRTTGPYGFFIELDFFTLRYTVYHSPQPAVSDWQSLLPNGCISGLIIPQFKGLILRMDR